MFFFYEFTFFLDVFFICNIFFFLLTCCFLKRMEYTKLPSKTVVGFLIVFFLCNYLLINDKLVCSNSLSVSDTMINDTFSFLAKFVICLFCSFFLLSNFRSLKNNFFNKFESLLILSLSVLGLLLLCNSYDFLISYLALEISNLAFYVLAAFKKKSSYSVKSGLTYFLVGAMSSSLFLLGGSFVYVLTGSLKFYELYLFFELYVTNFVLYFFEYFLPEWIWLKKKINQPEFRWNFIKWWMNSFKDFDKWFYVFLLDPTVIRYDNSDWIKPDLGWVDPYSNWWDIICDILLESGIVFLIFSLCIKLGMAPSHSWSLNVFESSSTSVTFFFSVIAKLGVLILLIRFCYIIFFSDTYFWDYCFLLVGVLSVFVGAFGGLYQRKIKTLIAYSSISHLGYLLILFSATFTEGCRILFFYLIIYMLAGIGFWSFFLILSLRRDRGIIKYNKELGDFSGLKKSNLMLSLSVALLLFSLAGLPPISGFLAKTSLFFLPIMKTCFNLLSLIMLFLSVAATFYYIRIVKVLFFENGMINKLYYPCKSKWIPYLLSFVLYVILLTFMYPSFLFLIVMNAFPAVLSDVQQQETIEDTLSFSKFLF